MMDRNQGGTREMPTQGKTTTILPARTTPEPQPREAVPLVAGVPTTVAPAAPWLAAGAGTAAAQTATPRQLADHANGGYDAVPAPFVDHIVPTNGATGVPHTIQVYGTWVAGAIIMISGDSYPATVDAGAYLSIAYQPSTTGPKDVGIRNPDGQLSNTVPFAVP
jgi:hypothetical protein